MRELQGGPRVGQNKSNGYKRYLEDLLSATIRVDRSLMKKMNFRTFHER
tara:strand:+ start:202 stop:348 length:147 start_codon:yes stop_codon:yes gene_type:complete